MLKPARISMRFSPFPICQAALLLGVLSVSSATVQAQSTGAGKEAEEIDLSPAFERWNLTLKSQQQRDTCAVFTITAGIEFGLSKSLDEGVGLSEEYLNWAANQTNGDREDGASFAELQRGFGKWGIAEEREMPYRRAFDAALAPTPSARGSARQVWELKPKWNWLARDRASGVTAADIAAIKRVLRRGFPVCAGGEHCMLLVGYAGDWEGGVTFLARDYATANYQTLTAAEVQRRFESLLWIEFPKLAEE